YVLPPTCEAHISAPAGRAPWPTLMPPISRRDSLTLGTTAPARDRTAPSAAHRALAREYLPQGSLLDVDHRRRAGNSSLDFHQPDTKSTAFGRIEYCPQRPSRKRDKGGLTRGEVPRLCRGGSSSLTFSAVGSSRYCPGFTCAGGPLRISTPAQTGTAHRRPPRVLSFPSR